ncbi:MAG: LL-diaminopimelate aminotransferase [Candidatus Gygaella obscura]|nr:LL-diaminopimelate aminotransferase [Candidatus Gygaella obscura]
MSITTNANLLKLPPYLFLEIDKAKRQARAQGRSIIDLGIGDPDLPTPNHIIDSLCKAARDPQNHRYALDKGMPDLRKEIANWYKKRFSVTLNFDKEIQPLLGSKDGISHLPFILNNKGDYNLVPDPCYPPYRNCTILAGAKPFLMPLLEKNSFFPELGKIPKAVLKKAKLIFINYPNNPTSALAPLSFFKDLVRLAKKNNIIIASDEAYSEMFYGKMKPPSILQVPGAKKIAVEFHSLSKTYNMTGWRLGWVCGNEKIIKEIAKFKSNIDSGVFQAIQLAGITALKTPKSFLEKNNKIYRDRREIVSKGLRSLGWDFFESSATFYVWVKVPGEISSIEFSKLVLDKCDMVVTPGVGFGKYGEGYFRISLTVGENLLKKGVSRLSRLK